MEKFMKLPKEKRDRILKSAIEEFGKNGYISASTDLIASNSQISKGSLFNYFGNKKNLYIFTAEYISEVLNNEILNEVDKIEDNDFFSRMKHLSLIKQNMFIKYPDETKILIEAFISPPQELKDEIEVIYKKYYIKGFNILQDYIIKYINIDMLKKNIKSEDAMFVVMTLFEALAKKYTQEYSNETKDLLSYSDEIFREFDKYIDIIKYGIYKS
jgi:TetR/AcrR family transcriptional regulator